jgi:catechol-2,3-dioxygenase
MSRSRPTKFAHVVYRTRRFEEMLKWYETVFDARVQYQNPGMAFLTYDDEHHRFAFANLSLFLPDGTETNRQGAIGVDHVAYTYESLPGLLENYADLKEKGISPYWAVHHGITASLYYADPDGNQMEFQVDCCSSSDEASAYFKESFDVNPVGVEFDPDDWLARLRSGVPVSELLVRTVHEPVSPIRGSIAEMMPAGSRH